MCSLDEVCVAGRRRLGKKPEQVGVALERRLGHSWLMMPQPFFQVQKEMCSGSTPQGLCISLWCEVCKMHSVLSKRCTMLGWGIGHSLYVSGLPWGMVVKARFGTVWSLEGTCFSFCPYKPLCGVQQTIVCLYIWIGIMVCKPDLFSFCNPTLQNKWKWLSGLVAMANFGLSKLRNT